MNSTINTREKISIASKFGAFLILLATISIFITFCNKSENCEYKNDCTFVDSLNLSTGIDLNGNVLTPGLGVVDPNWRLLNRPPILGVCPITTINGNAYVINYPLPTSTGWVNQPGTAVLAPADLGGSADFGCNNAFNSADQRVPYIFERPFCVIENTDVDFNFTFRGDDQLLFELFNNSTNNVVSTSSTYIYPGSTQSWSATTLSLTKGSYSIRSYLTNTSSVVLGFTLSGSITTHDGKAELSNNTSGCCENNVITILNILDNDCDSSFTTGDQIGNGWTFNLKDSNGNIIQTGITDINGNLFFSGLPDGDYTIEIVVQTGWTTLPASGKISVALSSNAAYTFEFFNCPLTKHR